MIARLKPGATLAQAQAQIDAQNDALEADDPEAKMMADAGFRSVVAPLHADHVASVRPLLLWLQAGALALLLIGAVNLTNLLLIRASGRSKEMAVRRALGASRWHVVSEAIVETTLLTLAGGLLGLAVGRRRHPPGDCAWLRTDYRWGVTSRSTGGWRGCGSRRIALGLALAAPIAWFNLRGHPGRRDPIGVAWRNGQPGRSKLASWLHGRADCVGFVLLSGAGLLGLSLERAMAVSPGFRPDHVLYGTNLSAGEAVPGLAARLAFNERLLRDWRASREFWRPEWSTMCR